MSSDMPRPPRLLFLVTEDWYFWSHRIDIARAARDAGFEVSVATRVAGYGKRIVGEGFTLYPLPWRRSGGVIGELRTIRKLIGIYSKIRPDVVHHVAIKPAVYGSLAARVVGVSRVVNGINGLGFAFTSNSIRARAARLPLTMAFRMLIDRPDTIVVLQHEDDRKRLVDGGYLRRARTAIVRGSGIDLSRFVVLPLPVAQPPTVAIVSRMLAIKGIHPLIEASRLLRRRGVRHRLLLVGAPDPDNPSSISEKTLLAWAKEPDVFWLGHRDDIRGVWAEADIAVLPSLGGEGVPKTLLEAAACGRPIVATDIPGSREIAIENVNALLVPPGNPEKLADALQKLIVDKDLRIRLAKESRRLVENDMSAERVTASMLALYRDLLSQ